MYDKRIQITQSLNEFLLLAEQRLSLSGSLHGLLKKGSLHNN
jgi:hypothetical protein